MAFHFGFGSFASFSTTGRERAFAIRDECLFCAAVKPSKEPLQTTRTRNRNPIVAHFGGFFSGDLGGIDLVETSSRKDFNLFYRWDRRRRGRRPGRTSRLRRARRR